MKFALMQPYFLPYVGYWQLMKEVDIFVISDDTKYVKQSWINRNLILNNGALKFITVPVASSSDFEKISEKIISESFSPKKIRNQIIENYRVFHNTNAENLVEEISKLECKNLIDFLMGTINLVSGYLRINTQVVRASEICIPRELKGVDRIYWLGKKLELSEYINLPGGREIYSKHEFEGRGINLKFIDPYSRTKPFQYPQQVSIIDTIFRFAKGSPMEELALNDYCISEN